MKRKPAKTRGRITIAPPPKIIESGTKKIYKKENPKKKKKLSEREEEENGNVMKTEAKQDADARPSKKITLEKSYQEGKHKKARSKK